ncbi:MAG: hypothetical protein ACKO14_08290 [Armatimonadota bacterium]
MKQSCGLLILVLLMLAGCKPFGHGVTQTLFHKDIYLNIPASDFKETNRRSLRTLPHTWVSIKRISAVLTDGTVIPCRDFQPTPFEMVQDESRAVLLGSLELPVPDVAEVTVVVGKSGQCSGADDTSLRPCTFEMEPSGKIDASTATPLDETSLTYRLPSRERGSTRLVLHLKANRDATFPKATIPVTFTCTGQLPIALDVIETPWLSILPVAGVTPDRLPLGLSCPLEVLKTSTACKGIVDPDSMALSPIVMFDLKAPSRVAIGGTVVRLDIDKKTFQLRVSDTTDGKAYGTLFFRAGDLTSYAFPGGQSPATVPATFDDIGIGRKIWISVLDHFDPDDRLEALDIRILDRNAPQR